MKKLTKKPRISCIVTAFNEGPLARISIASLLAQTFDDFEILLVDDGASQETRDTLHSFSDPRIKHIRQANDGLSSARNRALNVAQGDYVCFLDADDTRPPWAFEELWKKTDGGVDVVFSSGLLCELRKQLMPFYDQEHFKHLHSAGKSEMAMLDNPAAWTTAIRQLACVEPQCANKFVRREFLQQHKLRFPAGLFFEDMIFHYGLIANMRSYALTERPTFTYFRRYGRPQITSGTSTTRFDAVSTATNALYLFSLSEHFQDAVLRKLILASTFKLISWCEDCVSHDHKYAFQQAVRALIAGLNPRYLEPLDESNQQLVLGYAPWVGPALQYIESACDPIQ